MIVDSSVWIAISLKEPGFEALKTKLSHADTLSMPTPIFVETCMVIKHRQNADAVIAIENYMESLNVNMVPFTSKMAKIAKDAFLKYGKGQNHPAQLNFGDCMVYATAKVEGLPLLFRGDDFARTDVRVV